jgi:hypothetical protein
MEKQLYATLLHISTVSTLHQQQINHDSSVGFQNSAVLVRTGVQCVLELILVNNSQLMPTSVSNTVKKYFYRGR